MSSDIPKIDEDNHKLKNTWVLWYHLPQNKDWSIKSYIKICDFRCVENVINVLKIIPENITSNCCFFVMKTGIEPMWEHILNRNGGCFSYRISNKFVNQTWKYLTYALTGETISTNKKFVENVNGISISPKKNFCVIKVWMKICEFQNPELITNEIKHLTHNSALFKVHKPEF